MDRLKKWGRRKGYLVKSTVNRLAKSRLNTYPKCVVSIAIVLFAIGCENLKNSNPLSTPTSEEFIAEDDSESYPHFIVTRVHADGDVSKEITHPVNAELIEIFLDKMIWKDVESIAVHADENHSLAINYPKADENGEQSLTARWTRLEEETDAVRVQVVRSSDSFEDPDLVLNLMTLLLSGDSALESSLQWKVESKGMVMEGARE